MRILYFIILALFTNLLYAQVIIDGVPRDTSFNVQSTYMKEVKRRPYIKIVEPNYTDSIVWFEGITYLKLNRNRELKLNIYRPNNEEKYPALLMVHGGGWSSGDLSMQIPMAQEIALRGYVTIPVEYRLSPEAKYPAAVHDLKVAVKWIRANANNYLIDTTKIAISGCSAGGQLASLIGATNGQESYEGPCGNVDYSSDVHAVINIDGSLDFTVQDGIDRVNADLEKGKLPASVKWLGGSYGDRKDLWIEASPVYQVTEESVPVCFINSSISRFHDGRDSMIVELSKYDIYTEVHTIDDTPHPFWLLHPWFNQTVQYMNDFLDVMFK